MGGCAISCDSQKQNEKWRNYFSKGKRIPKEQWVVPPSGLSAGTLHDTFLKVLRCSDEMSFHLSGLYLWYKFKKC